MHRRSDVVVENGQMHPRHARWLVIPLLLALPSLAAYAAPNTPDSLRVSSTNTYAAGTPEWRQVRDWLAQHQPSHDGTAQAQNLERLGPLVLSYARALHRVPTQAPEALPLPEQGTPGDSIAISSCAGGVRQSWVYSVETPPAGVWTLTSFATSQTADCAQADSTH
ncbi:hypothetical protein M3S04_20150 [Xanthomonas sp. PPL139]|uniref:hypothetical protein n=1 Tax=unclassified Xanthomonas TaxID=2643310 RepID=UPI0033BBC6D5